MDTFEAKFKWFTIKNPTLIFTSSSVEMLRFKKFCSARNKSVYALDPASIVCEGKLLTCSPEVVHRWVQFLLLPVAAIGYE